MQQKEEEEERERDCSSIMFASRLSPSLSASILHTHTHTHIRERKNENRTWHTQINIFIAAVFRLSSLFFVQSEGEEKSTRTHKTVIETREDVRCTRNRKSPLNAFPTVILVFEEKVTQYHRRETGTDCRSIVDSQSKEIIIIVQQALFGKTSC